MSKEPSCAVENALVSGSNPIPDAKITVSSIWDALNAPPHYARINNTAGWAGWVCNSIEYTALEPRMYIQVCSLPT